MTSEDQDLDGYRSYFEAIAAIRARLVREGKVKPLPEEEAPCPAP